MSKPFTMVVIDAVLNSDLAPDLKFLLMTMAYLSDSKTGRGLSGQATIGRLIGCSDRAVRLKLERLVATTDSPVQVERRYRQRKDGRGRTSDEYQLVLTNRKPASGKTPTPTGSELPLEGTVPDGDQPEAQCGPTGSPVQDQPEAGFQGSSLVILLDDPRSISVAPKSATRRRRGASKRNGSGTSKSIERTPEQKAAFTRIRDCYFAAFENCRGEKPVFGKAEGAAVYALLEKLGYDEPKAEKAIITAYQSFRAKSVTILNIASNPQGFEVQPAKARNGRAPEPQPANGTDYDFDRFEARNAQD